ncbi:MAG: HAMP domain-containing histidine kinase, partial [Ignavibacteriaceae bacterium]|nr:HAMP domain-containing histidine kinase [Ignavibacteriaceae bacterium]
ETNEAKSGGAIKEAVQSIDNGGKRLVRTIDLILNMSMVQTGNYDLSPRVLNIQEILFKLVTEFKAAAETKNIKLSLQNNSKNANVFVDEYTINQAFHNLIDNAVKYTRKGHIGVILFDSVNGVSVTIEDTGIGISEEYLQKLFQPFSQEESGYSRRFEGNGLGLALTKKYFELNNAKISVDSEKGKGTKFKIHFCNV